jgi:Kef-type K+ transport system membrane component KefB
MIISKATAFASCTYYCHRRNNFNHQRIRHPHQQYRHRIHTNDVPTLLPLHAIPTDLITNFLSTDPSFIWDTLHHHAMDIVSTTTGQHHLLDMNNWWSDHISTSSHSGHDIILTSTTSSSSISDTASTVNIDTTMSISAATTDSTLMPQRNIDNNINNDHRLTPEIEEMSLSALGHDILLFLAAAVVVDPLGKILGVAPVLLYLLLGFVAGPYGLSLFNSGTEVDSEIGDFGILFLLFIEGLNLSPERLKALGGFFSLGVTQLILSLGCIFFGLFFGGPYLLPIVQDVRVPIDPNLITLLEKPVIAFSIASAGALSSSAFVLPILKEKGWEKGSDGIAALSILLLQDLAVAPILVILPLIAAYDLGGSSATQDPMALGVVVAKATIGFGSVLVLASVVLRNIFQIVAKFGSSQTFVATSLLVAAGMGIVADNLGLSSTTGAFAAGVLLAESGYRAQIEADIQPFESILLGVFFVTAGASLDPQTVITEWPTLLAGISIFILVKFGVVLAAGQFALGLTRADAVRVAFLLAGGGEFAFVIFKLANNLGALPEELTKLLTASVIISMSLTPVLGELANWSGTVIQEMEDSANAASKSKYEDYDVNLTSEERIREAFEAFDEDGSGAISASELRQVLTKPGMANSLLSLEEVQAIIQRFDDDNDGELQFDEFAALWTAKRRSSFQKLGKESTDLQPNLTNAIVVCGYGEVAQQLCASLDVPYVAFSRDPSRISQGVLNGASVVYGNGASPSLIQSVGVEKPSAIVVTYATEERCLEATLRLHEAFPDVPIYARAERLENVEGLVRAGATNVVVQTRKVALAFQKLVNLKGAIKDRMIEALENIKGEPIDVPYSEIELTELAYTCDVCAEELAQLYELYSTSVKTNDDGHVELAELCDEMLRQRNTPIDDKTYNAWLDYTDFTQKWDSTVTSDVKWVTFPEFVRFAAGKM